MKIYKDLNTLVVKDRKLIIAKNYKFWISIGFLLSLLFIGIAVFNITT